MISKSCKYAIRAAVFIASKTRDNVKLGVKEIATEIEAPAPFTGKILQTLNKNKIVTSLKGPYGGFYCEPQQLDLSVMQIVNAIDGENVFRECVMGLHTCSDAHPCPMHHKVSETQDRMLQSFKETSIRSLAEELIAGSAFVTNRDLGIE